MLTGFVGFFARRWRLTLGVWLILVAFGAAAYAALLPREGFPSVDVPIAVASGPYFAGDPERVDADVLAPLYEAVRDIDEIDSIETFARANAFSVLAEFDTATTSVEGAELMAAAIAEAPLPDGVEVNYQAIDAARFLNEFDLLVAVSGSGVDAARLDEAAEALAAFLAADDEIPRAEAQTLQSSAIDPDTGQTSTRQTSFSSTTVGTGSGLVFQPSVVVGVRGPEGVDQLELSDRVADLLDEAEALDVVADEFTLQIAADFASQIRSQLGSLQANVATGVVAVFVVTLLLISWRASLITALFVGSVMATLMGVLYLFGITLNTISLFGVILTLGLFVDDAIVIVEAIDAFRDRRAGPLETISTAIRRVGAASVAGTLTTVLVFAPLLFISGILGDFIRQLPVTVIIALLTSLVLSLVLIPTASRGILLNAEPRRGLLGGLEERLGRATAALPALRNRPRRTPGRIVSAVGFAASLVLLVAGVMIAGSVGFDIFPEQDDSDVIGLTAEFDAGTSLAEAEELIAEVNGIVLDETGELLDTSLLYVGNETNAFADYTLVSFRDRSVTAPELVERIQPRLDALEGARLTIQQVGGGPPREDFPFQAQVYGEDLEASLAVATEMADELEGSRLSLASGEEFTVTETLVALDDVVARLDGRRLVEVRAKFDSDEVSSLLEATEERVNELFGPEVLAERGLAADAIGFDYGLESENQESFASTQIAFVAALVLMFVLLVVQFRSLLQPLLIFLAIPFSFFGVFTALALTDNPVSFFVFIGLIGLIGIAVNNTILLTDFANQERRAGADRVTAISAAVRQRFRPLVATSLTTVAGLLPLALSDPFWEPLAITIIGGLLSSTFLVLVSFPYYYLAVEWTRDVVWGGLKQRVRG